MLELRNIDFSAGGKHILKDVSFTLGAGKFIAITGPNGSGKSTLAKIILGIETPQRGQVLFNGEDITDYTIDQRARLGMAFGFQQPVRFKGLRVKDLLSLAAGKNTSVNEACSYLSEVGLCARDYVDRELNDSLSGGELKRIEIAMVLARGTKLSIFDEPEAGIDLWSFDRLTETFRDIHEARDGRSIVIISHQERIIQLADEIVLLRDGKVAETGTPEELMPKLGFVAKGIPGCSFTEPPELHLTEIPTTC